MNAATSRISSPSPTASEPWRSLYPFESRWLETGGQRYHFVDEGRGIPLLFVHGNPTWSFLWRNLIRDFRDQFRTVAVDHIGCGLSDKPLEYDYSLTQHSANLVQLIDHLDLRNITLVVHDWGGPIGTWAALQRPERIARLVFLNTGTFPPPYIPWRIRVCRLPVVGQWAVQRHNLFARAAQWMALHNRQLVTSQALAGLIAPYDSWQHRVAIHRFVMDIPASPRHRTWQQLLQLEQQLPSLSDRPALCVWGMRDWCFRPDCLQKLIDIFPRARVHRLPQAGHWVTEEAPDRVRLIMNTFLTQTDLAQTNRLEPHG